MPLPQFRFPRYADPPPHRSVSSASSARSFHRQPLRLASPPKTAAEAAAALDFLVHEYYLSSEEDLSPTEEAPSSPLGRDTPDEDEDEDEDGDGDGDVYHEASSTAFDSLPERLANSCPGQDSRTATTVAFANAGKAKVVHVVNVVNNVSPTFARPQSLVLHRRRRNPSGSALGSAPPSSPPTSPRSSSRRFSMIRHSRDVSAQELPASTVQAPPSKARPSLASSQSADSIDLTEKDGFENAPTQQLLEGSARGATPRHQRRRSLSRIMSKAILGSEDDEVPPVPLISRHKLALRGATEGQQMPELLPCPTVSGRQDPHPRSSRGETIKLSKPPVKTRKSFISLIR